MKAAAYSKAGPPSVLVYQDVPDPVCGPRDVLIDVHAISIEGGDVLARAGGFASNPATRTEPEKRAVILASSIRFAGG